MHALPQNAEVSTATRNLKVQINKATPFYHIHIHTQQIQQEHLRKIIWKKKKAQQQQQQRLIIITAYRKSH